MGHLVDTRMTAGGGVLARTSCGSAAPIRTGTMDDPGSRAATTSTLVTGDGPGSRAATTSTLVTVASPLDAGPVGFDAASMGTSRLPASVCAGRITDTAMVITVIATVAIPSTKRGMDDS